MTADEAKKQEMFWIDGNLAEAVDAVTKAREKLIKLYPDRKTGEDAANHLLPYEAMFRMPPI